MSYNPTKAAQVIAKLLLCNGGQSLNIVKVMKLVYLCDREFIRRWGVPILDEQRVAMKHGPVNSMTYRYVNGEAGPDPEGWKSFVSDRESHEIGLSRPVGLSDLDLLSAGEQDVIASVWQRFGNMGTWDLVRWTHDSRNIPEWSDPGDTSRPIPVAEIMKAVGLTQIEEMTEVLEEHGRIDALFDEIRVH